MASWLIKAAVQRCIGALPNPHFWNALVQDHITHSVRLSDELFEDGLQVCKQCFERLRVLRPGAPNGFSGFDLGTGWYPVIPIGLFLCGARDMWTWDIAEYVTQERLQLTISRFFDRRQMVEEYLSPEPERFGRLEELMRQCQVAQRSGTKELLEPLGIHYRIGNAAKTGLPVESVNLIVSNGVLEYISPELLSDMLKEFRRIAAPDSLMSHTIDLADQYATFDSGITQFNFLRFSDGQWRWLNNPLIPLNRLRISDYRAALAGNGFEIIDEKNRLGDASALERTTLAQRFRSYSVDDLMVVHTRLLAVPVSKKALSASATTGN
jgi:hypothetical protein